MLDNEYSEQVSEEEKGEDNGKVGNVGNVELIEEDSINDVAPGKSSLNLNDDEINTLIITLTNFKNLRFENHVKRSAKFKSKFKSPNSASSTIFDADYFKQSEFYGFYIIFWLATGFFIFNQVIHHYFQNNEIFLNGVIMKLFRTNLLQVAVADGAMYFSMIGVVPIQLLIKYGVFSWNIGYYLQSAYEVIYMVFWLYIINTSTNFTWIARVFLALNSMVYLMKMHSYGFYNGYLWTIYQELQYSQTYLQKLKKSDTIDPEAEKQLIESIAFCTFELEYQAKVTSLCQDVDALTMKIINKIIYNQGQVDQDNDNYFPNNITFANYFMYSVFPTVVYTLNFPRTTRIRWKFVFEKICGVFGIIVLMIIVAENFMLPLIWQSIEIRKLPLKDRLVPFLLVLLDMIPPFLFQYIFAFFLIWDQILNAVAELTMYADRDFYGPWWSSSDWSDFARLWNKPVHNFLLRHVYHSSIASIKVNKTIATLITFIISSIIHEIVMMCIFKTFRGYLFWLQMSQIPLVMFSRLKFMRDKKVLGILICWIGFMTGPPIICTLYLIY